MTEDFARQLAALSPAQRKALAERLRARRSDEPGGTGTRAADGSQRAGTAREPGGSREAAFLSLAQERLWFLDAVDPGNSAYNIVIGIRLSGPLDPQALERALAAVVGRHDALRTVFVETDQGPRQAERGSVPVRLPVTDLRGEPDIAAAWARFAARYAEHAFDLSGEPLFTAGLARTGEDEHRLCLVVHHIVFDGWSGNVLVGDLVQLYGAFAAGLPDPLPALRRSFAQYAAAERAALTDEVLERHLAYWRRKLAGAPTLSTVPPDHPRASVQSRSAGRRPVEFSAELTERLLALARGEGTTLNTVVVAAMAALVRHGSGQCDVLLGVPVAGRTKVELEAMVGCFANTLVVRTAVEADMTVREFIRHTHRTVSEAYGHQAVPYARVVEAVAPARDRGQNPLFQIMVSVNEGEGSAPHTAAGVVFQPEEIERDRTDFDVFLTLQRDGGALTGTLAYSTDLYLDETAHLLEKALRRILSDFAELPDHRIARLPGLRRRTLAITDTFTSDFVHDPVTFWSRYLRVPIDITPAPYAQLILHLLSGPPGDATVAYLRWEDWLRRWRGQDRGEDPAAFLSQVLGDVAHAARVFRERSEVPLILMVCPPSGTWAELAHEFGRLDDRLLRELGAVPGVSVVFASEWIEPFAVTEVFDSGADDVGHVPYTPEFYALLGTVAVRRVLEAWGEPWPPAGSQRAEHISGRLTAADAIRARATVADRAAGADGGEFVAPRTPAEQRLAALWGDVLGTGDIGVTRDFFSLGGHSLLATHLVSKIRAAFGRELSMHAFLSHPTVERLAGFLETQQQTADSGPGAVVPVARGGELEPSSTQRRMWALAQLGDAAAAHNTMYAVRLHGRLDERALRTALDEVVRRHEVLRSSFTAREGSVSMVLRDRVEVWLDSVDLLRFPPAERAREVRRRIEDDVLRPYALEDGPLLRARLMHEGEDLHYLLIGMHHSVCDDSSWTLFLAELAEFYGASAEHRGAEVPDLPLQYADFAAWQNAWLAGPEAERHLEFWRRRLVDAPPVLNLGCARERPARRAGRAASVVRPLPAQLSQAVRDLSQRESVSPFTTVLAALSALFHQESGQSQFVIGVPNRGRDRQEFEHVLGYFADLMPVRIDVGGRLTFRRLLQRIKRIMADVTTHQGIPLSSVVDAVRPPRSSSHHPLFQYVVNFVERLDPEAELPGLRTEHVAAVDPGTDFDAFFTITSSAGELTVEATYATDLFDTEAMHSLLLGLEETLLAAVADPETVVDGSAGAAVSVRPAATLTAASTFPLRAVASEAARWADHLGITIAAETAPAGSVLRPLLDPDFRAGRPPEDLRVLFLRWEDLLGPDPAPGGGRALAATVWHSEEALRQLCSAVRAFRHRPETANTALTMVICPESAGWQRYAPVFAGLGDRMRKELEELPGVDVVYAAEVAAVHYGADPFPTRAAEPDRTPDQRHARHPGPSDGSGRLADSPYSDRFQTVLGALAVRRLLQSSGLSPQWVALRAGGWTADELGRFAAEQLGYGRKVVIGTEDRLPLPLRNLAGLTTVGADLVPEVCRLGTDGTHTAATGLVLTADAGAAQALRRASPSTVTVLVPAGSLARNRLILDCWLLDRPVGMAQPRPLEGVASPFAPATAHEVTAESTTKEEQLLATIWSELLHLDDVDVHGDFFALGGDSMTAIEVAYRATEAGLTLTPRQVVDNPTIARLGAVAARSAAPQPEPEPAAEVTAAGLAPAQHWFLDAVGPGMSRPAHFNHPYYLQLSVQVEPDVVRRALGRLAAVHDSLRLEIRRDEDGRWRQSRADAARGPHYRYLDVSALPAAGRDAAVEEAAARTQGSLALDGPLVRVLHVRMGEAAGDRILFVAHHLVTDGVSRGILLDDLRRLLTGHPGDGEPALARSTPYLNWVAGLTAYAQSAQLRDELPFWRDQRPSRPPAIPFDLPGRMTFGTLRHTGFSFSEPETAHLLDAARERRTKLHDLLVWAVAGFLADWTDSREVSLAFTGHGRDVIADDLDLSRTTGWFQIFYPLRLAIPQEHRNPATVAEFSRQLARVPGTGIGWSALRYSCQDAEVRRQLAEVSLPRVSFNYTGHFNLEESRQGADLFALCHEPYGLEQDGDGFAPFDLDFVASMAGPRLHLEVNYGLHCHRPETIQSALDEIRNRLLGAINR